MNNSKISLDGKQCWDEIGVNGDFTCPELTTHTHCRNCPVYSAAGCHLLERPIPQDYRQEWTQLLAESTSETKSRDKLVLSPKDSNSLSHISPTTTFTVVIFRLGCLYCPSVDVFIIQKHHGQIIVNSIPKCGTEFIIEISIVQPN